MNTFRITPDTPRYELIDGCINQFNFLLLNQNQEYYYNFKGLTHTPLYCSLSDFITLRFKGGSETGKFMEAYGILLKQLLNEDWDGVEVTAVVSNSAEHTVVDTGVIYVRPYVEHREMGAAMTHAYDMGGTALDLVNDITVNYEH